MGLFEQFPYANFHELNLDWILHELKELETEITNFVAINSVKYANPIIWDITSQYETNTVVLDNSGNAYLSVQPVPAGVSLDRTEYWTQIGNFSALWDSVRSAITPYDEQHNTTASIDHKAGDWVWVENDLLLITKNIIAGDKYVDGGNCKKTNVHDLFVTLSGELQNESNARETGDAALDAKITAEAQARETGDAALDAKITAEAQARTDADATLDGKIVDEAKARTEADATLAEQISKSGAFINFKAFGAVGDGITDDTAAINACIAEAVSKSVGISGNFGSYAISNTITVDGSALKHFHVEGVLLPAFTDKPALIIRDSRRGAYTAHVRGSTFNGGYTFPGWADYNQGELPFKGIKIDHCQESVFTLSARYCNTGISIESAEQVDGTGCAYNTFTIEDITDCAVELDIMAKDGGWCNENLIMNANISESTKNPNAAKCIGIRIWTNNSEHVCNNNVFIKPCLQCRGIPVVLENAWYNKFESVRCESTKKPDNNNFYVRTRGTNARNNSFFPLYGFDDTLYEKPEALAFNLAAPNLIHNSSYRIPFFTWNYDKRKAAVVNKCILDDVIDTYFPGMDLTNPTYIPGSVSDAGLTATSGGVIGRFIDLSKAKAFGLLVSGNNVRHEIVLFDESFNTINATTNDVQSFNLSAVNTWLSKNTINGIDILYAQIPQEEQFITYAITNDTAKYAFIGACGTNMTYLSIFGVETRRYAGMPCNVLPKKIKGPTDT